MSYKLQCWFTMFIAHFLLLYGDWNWFTHISRKWIWCSFFFFFPPSKFVQSKQLFPYWRGHQHLPLAFVPGQDTKLVAMPFFRTVTNSCLELEGTSCWAIPRCSSIRYLAPHRALGEAREGHTHSPASWWILHVAVTWSDAKHHRLDSSECPAKFIVVLV